MHIVTIKGYWHQLSNLFFFLGNWSDCALAQSLATIECSNGEQISGSEITHVQKDMTSHVLRMNEGYFSLDAAQLIIRVVMRK